MSMDACWVGSLAQPVPHLLSLYSGPGYTPYPGGVQAESRSDLTGEHAWVGNTWVDLTLVLRPAPPPCMHRVSAVRTDAAFRAGSVPGDTSRGGCANISRLQVGHTLGNTHHTGHSCPLLLLPTHLFCAAHPLLALPCVSICLHAQTAQSPVLPTCLHGRMMWSTASV